MHAVEADAPVVVRNMPAEHPVQEVAPIKVWYWPAAQPMHAVKADAPAVVK